MSVYVKVSVNVDSPPGNSWRSRKAPSASNFNASILLNEKVKKAA